VTGVTAQLASDQQAGHKSGIGSRQPARDKELVAKVQQILLVDFRHEKSFS
jgi:hypothetical protein